jgi:predicted nucleic acid-binding protein
MYPQETWNSLNVNVLPHFEIVSLSRRDYTVALERCASLGVGGGRVYDALHIQAAIKAECEELCTFNVKDFQQLSPRGFTGKIVLPR